MCFTRASVACARPCKNIYDKLISSKQASKRASERASKQANTPSNQSNPTNTSNPALSTVKLHSADPFPPPSPPAPGECSAPAAIYQKNTNKTEQYSKIHRYVCVTNGEDLELKPFHDHVITVTGNDYVSCQWLRKPRAA